MTRQFDPNAKRTSRMRLEVCVAFLALPGSGRTRKQGLDTNARSCKPGVNAK